MKGLPCVSRPVSLSKLGELTKSVSLALNGEVYWLCSKKMKSGIGIRRKASEQYVLHRALFKCTARAARRRTCHLTLVYGFALLPL